MIEAQSHYEPQVEAVESTTEQKVITVSSVLEDLENGLGRPLIKTKYNLTVDELKVLFEHPALKGRRPKRATKKISFVLVDDTYNPNQTSIPMDTFVEEGSDFDIDESEQTILQVEDSVSENANEDNFFELND